MSWRLMDRWFLLGAFLLGALLALEPVHAQGLTVFAAASMKEALDEAGQGFQRGRGRKVVVSYAASSALAKQIENGAPADVFISADLDWMDYIEQRKLIRAGTRANLLRNRLVLIAPADGKLQTEIKPGFGLAKLLGDGKLSMADPDSVPAGKYGKAALEKLGEWRSVEGKVARGDNVRTALNFVARGEAPLGIVYETDAYAEKQVRIVARFPESSHPAIIYPAAVVATSKHAAAAVFVSYLKSAEARAIFEKYGFSVEK
ncbi:MAG: molybdate ABC transporter substrate-binding protein [Burkholderiales bacterium]